MSGIPWPFRVESRYDIGLANSKALNDPIRKYFRADIIIF